MGLAKRLFEELTERELVELDVQCDIWQDEAIRAQDAELEAERLAAESDALIEEDNARAIEAADASCLCDICLA